MWFSGKLFLLVPTQSTSICLTRALEHILLGCTFNSLKGTQAPAEVRLGEKDSLRPSALLFAAIKNELGIYMLHLQLCRLLKNWMTP